MAVPPETNEAFLREVDEELRRDELARLWKRWGLVLIAVIVVGLIALAAFLWWRSHQAQQAGLEGEKLTAAIDQLSSGQTDQALPALRELSKSPRSGYRAAAQLAMGAIDSQKKDPKAAIAAFAAVAKDESIAKPFRDLALIRQTTMEFDTLSPDQVIARMKPLAQKGSPWFGSAGELTAVAQLKAGRPTEAGATFAALVADPGVPASIRSRAAQMASVLGVSVNPVAQPSLPR